MSEKEVSEVETMGAAASGGSKRYKFSAEQRKRGGLNLRGLPKKKTLVRASLGVPVGSRTFPELSSKLKGPKKELCLEDLKQKTLAVVDSGLKSKSMKTRVLVARELLKYLFPQKRDVSLGLPGQISLSINRGIASDDIEDAELVDSGESTDGEAGLAVVIKGLALPNGVASTDDIKGGGALG